MVKIGYLTQNGEDLGDIFNGNGIFTNSITTNGGIVGPPQITYNANMIGHTVIQSGPSSSLNNIQSETDSIQNYQTVASFTFPSVGVWMVTLYGVCTISASASAGTVNYINLMMSTSTSAASPSGEGSFKIRASGTSTTPASGTNLYITASCTVPAVITSTSPTYYFYIQTRFSSVTSVSIPSSFSYYFLTRIA